MRKLDGGQIDDPGEGVPSREGPRVRGLRPHTSLISTWPAPCQADPLEIYACFIRIRVIDTALVLQSHGMGTRLSKPLRWWPESLMVGSVTSSRKPGREPRPHRIGCRHGSASYWVFLIFLHLTAIMRARTRPESLA